MDTTNWKELIKENFGELNDRQLWALARFAKMVRLRCKSNAAFNNKMNTVFPYATFRQIEKTRPKRFHAGETETYLGLQITLKGQVLPDQDSEE